MRRIRARVLAPLLLLLTAAPAGAQMPPPGAGPILFVRAEIEDAEYLGGLDNQTAQDSEPFIDGADYRVKLKITDVLIGKTE
ncbi:MAG TPA: hypothetical protein VLW75_07215, partial [Rhizomicrobium sp.]|nr:hypothetical protein [Rhizomicrobium sp.]